MLLLLQIFLLIVFWIYCGVMARKNKLPRGIYMWLIAYICGGFIGILVYAWYWRKVK